MPILPPVDYTVPRTHTISFFLGVKHRLNDSLPTGDVVYRAIMSTLNCPAAAIVCFQRLSVSSYQVTFHDSCVSMRENLCLNGFQINGARVSPVELEPSVSNVLVKNLPFEVPHPLLQDVMSVYGTVASVNYEIDSRTGCFTGSRIVKMHVDQQIPSCIRLGSYPIYIRYRSQRKCCRYCNRWDHVINTCPCRLLKRCIRCLSSTHTVAQCAHPWSCDNDPLKFDSDGDLITPLLHSSSFDNDDDDIFFPTLLSLAVPSLPDPFPLGPFPLRLGIFWMRRLFFKIPPPDPPPVFYAPPSISTSSLVLRAESSICPASTTVTMTTGCTTVPSSSARGSVVSSVVSSSAPSTSSVLTVSASSWTLVCHSGSASVVMEDVTPLIETPNPFAVLDPDLASTPPASPSDHNRSRSPLSGDHHPLLSSSEPSSPVLGSSQRKQSHLQAARDSALPTCMSVDDVALPSSPPSLIPVRTPLSSLDSVQEPSLPPKPPLPARPPRKPKIKPTVPARRPAKLDVLVIPGRVSTHPVTAHGKKS